MSRKSPNRTPHDEAIAIIEQLVSKNLGGDLEATPTRNAADSESTQTSAPTLAHPPASSGSAPTHPTQTMCAIEGPLHSQVSLAEAVLPDFFSGASEGSLIKPVPSLPRQRPSTRCGHRRCRMPSSFPPGQRASLAVGPICRR